MKRYIRADSSRRGWWTRYYDEVSESDWPKNRQIPSDASNEFQHVAFLHRKPQCDYITDNAYLELVSQEQHEFPAAVKNGQVCEVELSDIKDEKAFEAASEKFHKRTQYLKEQEKKAGASSLDHVPSNFRYVANQWCSTVLNEFAPEYGVNEFTLADIRLDPSYTQTKYSDEGHIIVSVLADGQNIGDYKLEFIRERGLWHCTEMTNDTSDDIQSFLENALG